MPEVKLVGEVPTHEDINELFVLSKVTCIGSWTGSRHCITTNTSSDTQQLRENR